MRTAAATVSPTIADAVAEEIPETTAEAEIGRILAGIEIGVLDRSLRPQTLADVRKKIHRRKRGCRTKEIYLTFGATAP